ncbi:MAG: hypothetical protein ACE37F_20275 [Nannocystaceae bacterium]|nr:hypothetical protein [bacterium]
MTLAHFIYIPGMLGLGMVIGFVLGGRAAQGAKADADDKAVRRKARQARRAARDRGPET